MVEIIEFIDGPMFFLMGFFWSGFARRFFRKDLHPNKWACPVPTCDTKLEFSDHPDADYILKKIVKDHMEHFHPDFIMIDHD